MENYKKNLIELISNVALEYKEYPSVVKSGLQKKSILREDADRPVRSTPACEGVSNEIILNMLSDLENCGDANVHSIVVMKGEKIISAASRPAFSPFLPHLAHSMSKSVTGILISLLTEDGKIDVNSHVIDFFPELKAEDARFGKITVLNLLNMSSGVGFGEVGVICADEWTKEFFASRMNFSPGEKFSYNSMNSYMLMHISKRVLHNDGDTVEEYLNRRLFSPLSIARPLWEYSPEGVEKGGFGLYLSAVSFAKIGAMMANGGKYGNRRILSEDTVKRATAKSISTGSVSDEFDYGYQMWVAKDGADFLFNGMFGQNVWVCPKNGIVVSVNCGNNELLSKGSAISIIRRALTQDLAPSRKDSRKWKKVLEEKEKNFFQTRQWIKPPMRMCGFLYSLGFLNKEPYNTAFDNLLGEYIFPRNNQGILPIFVRVMQNNYQGGIKSFAFERCGNSLLLISHEGASEIKINFGFYGYLNNEVSFGEEKYTVRACAVAEETEQGKIVYKLEMIFPELPNTRRITLYINELSRLSVELHELPDSRIADVFLDSIPAFAGRAGALYELIEKRLGKNFVKDKARELFSPKFTAVSSGAPDKDAFLADENEKTKEKINSSKLVRSLLFQFLGNTRKTQENDGGTLGRIAGIFGKFMGH